MLMITFFIDKGKKIIERLEDHMKSHYTVKKPILIEDHDSTDDSDIGIDEDTTAEAEVIDSEF